MEDKREYSVIEIETAKNLLAKGYGWIAQDKDGTVCAYCARPVKEGDAWLQGDDLLLLMDGKARGVIPIFDGISWADSEPVRLRDIVPQILTDEEREWLKVVVKPFRDRLWSLEAHDGECGTRYIALNITYPEKGREHIAEATVTTEKGREHIVEETVPIPEDWFEGMKNSYEYAPEELGL